MAVENLEKAWKYGHVDVGEVQEASILYTLKYLHKEQNEKKKGFDGINEFSLMSKGLGENYVNAQAKDFHSREYNGFVSLGRQKVTIPKYYKDKMLTKTQKEKQAKFMAKRAEEIEAEEQRIAKGVNIAEKKVKILMNKKNILNNVLKSRSVD